MGLPQRMGQSGTCLSWKSKVGWGRPPPPSLCSADLPAASPYPSDPSYLRRHLVLPLLSLQARRSVTLGLCSWVGTALLAPAPLTARPAVSAWLCAAGLRLLPQERGTHRAPRKAILDPRAFLRTGTLQSRCPRGGVARNDAHVPWVTAASPPSKDIAPRAHRCPHGSFPDWHLPFPVTRTLLMTPGSPLPPPHGHVRAHLKS